MNREQQIAKAEMYRCGAITTAFRGGEKQHESISKAKRHTRLAGLSCVAEKHGEHLRNKMDARIAAEEERVRLEDEARAKAEEEAKAKAAADAMLKAAE